MYNKQANPNGSGQLDLSGFNYLCDIYEGMSAAEIMGMKKELHMLYLAASTSPLWTDTFTPQERDRYARAVIVLDETIDGVNHLINHTNIGDILYDGEDDEPTSPLFQKGDQVLCLLEGIEFRGEVEKVDTLTETIYHVWILDKTKIEYCVEDQLTLWRRKNNE